MEKNQMKNMIVLKNLPSNLIEEAIIIFKSTKATKEYQYIDKNETIKANTKQNANNFIIREAENVISNYINSVEKDDRKSTNYSLKKKYKKLKIYSIIITALLIASFFV